MVPSQFVEVSCGRGFNPHTGCCESFCLSPLLLVLLTGVVGSVYPSQFVEVSCGRGFNPHTGCCESFCLLPLLLVLLTGVVGSGTGHQRSSYLFGIGTCRRNFTIFCSIYDDTFTAPVLFAEPGGSEGSGGEETQLIPTKCK